MTQPKSATQTNPKVAKGERRQMSPGARRTTRRLVHKAERAEAARQLREEQDAVHRDRAHAFAARQLLQIGRHTYAMDMPIYDAFKRQDANEVDDESLDNEVYYRLNEYNASLPVRLSLEGLDRILDQLKEEYTEAHARWVRSIIPELRDNRLFPTYTLPLVRSIYPNRSLWELLFREDDTSPRGRRSARMLGMTRADVESVYLLHVETGRGEDTEQPFVRVRVIFKLRDGHYRYCWWSAFPATMFSRRTAILTASAQARTLPRLVELLDPDDLPLSMTLALMARVAEAE